MDRFSPGDCQQRCPGLLERFEIFGLWNGVEYDSRPGLNMCGAVPEDDRPDDGPGVDIPICTEPTDAAAVRPSSFGFEFGNELDGPYFWCTREGPDREACFERVYSIVPLLKLSLNP